MLAADGMVNVVGVVLGTALDSFGVGGAADAGFWSTSGSSPVLTAAVFGSGQTALASSNQSSELDALFTALGQQDAAANANVQGALDSSGAGRGQMNDVISATLDDVTGLAPGSNTNGGLLALVNALAGRLEQAWQVLTTGSATASTQAAGSTQVAAGYNSLVSSPSGGVASMGALSSMGGLSTGALSSTGATQSALVPMEVWIPASTAAASTAAQAASTQQAASTSPTNATPTGATTHNTKAQTEINNVVSRAMGERGVPYSWGGGGPNGPSYGFDSGANTKGFDCSSLVQYAYAPYVQLPRTSELQYNVGTPVTPTSKYIRAGDLIFMNWGEQGPGPGHVMLAISPTEAVQAPETGETVGTTPIPTSGIQVRRILG